jgi:hypothetical protein
VKLDREGNCGHQGKSKIKDDAKLGNHDVKCYRWDIYGKVQTINWRRQDVHNINCHSHNNILVSTSEKW